jgi:leader peptidase (prepilin peptidase)/N-methyltransferase
MELINLLADNPGYFLISVALLSLAVGSFLNVVIYRLPIMMQTAWRDQCIEFLTADANTDAETLQTKDHTEKPFNLMVPRSACPQCGHQITAMENIPVISYLWLKGRCSNCKAPISKRYPAIEVLTAMLSVVVAWHFGVNWQCLGALFFTWALIAASLIDFDHKLLPDDITLPFLWIGVFTNLFGLYTDITSSIVGAIAGYLVLWSVYWLFKLLTGKEGMGYGDFKLLAMLGAWMGWQALPGIVLLSSLVGAIIGISLILLRGRDRNIPIPFGPYLAIAGWIYFLWGRQINEAYLAFAGIR